MEKNIRYIASKIVSMPTGAQLALLNTVMDMLPEKQKRLYVKVITNRALSKKRWNHIELWMESAFMKNYSKTPTMVANAYAVRAKMDRRMMPLLVRLAQKTKRRLAMRMLGERGSRVVD